MDNTALSVAYELCYKYSMLTHTRWYNIIKLISLFIKTLYLRYRFNKYNVFDQCDAIHDILYQIVSTENILFVDIDLNSKYIWFQSKKIIPYNILYYPTAKMFDISVENYEGKSYQFKYYLNQTNISPEVIIRFNESIPKIRIAIKDALDSVLSYLKTK